MKTSTKIWLCVPMWWVLLCLGIGGAVLGFFGLKNLNVTAGVLSAIIGLGAFFRLSSDLVLSPTA